MPAKQLSAESPIGSTSTSDCSSRAVLQRVQAKRAIVNQVINGRLPLLEAAARFEVEQRLTMAYFEPRVGLSTESDTEASCRALIGWVHLTLCDRPEQAETVSARLEMELQMYLERSRSNPTPPVK